uniref:hypothetical protein n=4 Tax=Morganellaceae TaxID=1903414 RepID=UPI000DCC6C04
PMPNSAVKRRSADGSVGSPHVRVGHCQALNTVETLSESWGFLHIRVCIILFAYIIWLPCLPRPVYPHYIGQLRRKSDLNVATRDGPQSERLKSCL